MILDLTSIVLIILGRIGELFVCRFTPSGLGMVGVNKRDT